MDANRERLVDQPPNLSVDRPLLDVSDDVPLSTVQQGTLQPGI